MSIFTYHIIGCIFTIICGTILHFTYNLSGKNKIIGMFSATNESTFEHLKLIYFPMLLFSIFEYFMYGRGISNFITVKMLTLILGMLLIITIFYTYTGILGTNYAFVNIALFMLSVCISYIFSYKMLNSCLFTDTNSSIISIICIVLITISFFIFTVAPPSIGIFKDPRNK